MASRILRDLCFAYSCLFRRAQRKVPLPIFRSGWTFRVPCPSAPSIPCGRLPFVNEGEGYLPSPLRIKGEGSSDGLAG